MLRAQHPQGWWLIRQPDHAVLASQFAEHWGNTVFTLPEPRADVLEGIRRHDDGWATRDQAPLITRQGKPSAFGSDLVGKYTAFEEIDLKDYLGVRGKALEIVARDNAYAAVLISMHTCNLLTANADRRTIQPDELPLLDDFVEHQKRRQSELKAACAASGRFTDADLSEATFLRHFRLLQACDCLSLLSCVDYEAPATLLHPLATKDGGVRTVQVHRVGSRTFRLDPYPFSSSPLSFQIPGRRVDGHTFQSADALQRNYAAAAIEQITVELIP